MLESDSLDSESLDWESLESDSLDEKWLLDTLGRLYESDDFESSELESLELESDDSLDLLSELLDAEYDEWLMEGFEPEMLIDESLGEPLDELLLEPLSEESLLELDPLLVDELLSGSL